MVFVSWSCPNLIIVASVGNKIDNNFSILFKFWIKNLSFFFEEENILISYSMEIESKYNACTTGGGDSSNQITSCTRLFACLAKRCATVLALLFTNCTCDHLNLCSKHSTSWIIWPIRDDKLLFNSRADMTDWLSPSTTISIKPHSNANSHRTTTRKNFCFLAARH